MLLGSVLAAAALATQKPDAKDWLETLSKTYAEQGGYLARYECHGPCHESDRNPLDGPRGVG